VNSGPDVFNDTGELVLGAGRLDLDGYAAGDPSALADLCTDLAGS